MSSSRTPHMWLAKNVTVPIIMTPASRVSLLYGLYVWASAAWALPVAVAELEVAAAVAGREESFASAYGENIMVSGLCLYNTSCVGKF